MTLPNSFVKQSPFLLVNIIVKSFELNTTKCVYNFVCETIIRAMLS